MGNRRFSASAGSGACYRALVRLVEGQYKAVVGSGGYSWNVTKNSDSPACADGGATVFYKDNSVLINVGGGTAAATYQSSGTAGTGGSIGVNYLDVVQTYQASSGNSGTTSGSSSGVSGATGVYSGHTYGASGNACGGYNYSTTTASKHGYFLLRYKYSTDKGDCYHGSDKIGEIYYGSNRIKYVYKGSKLVYQRQSYSTDQILAESNNATTLNIYVDMPGVYEIIAVGGGGGSSASGGGGGSSTQPTTQVNAVSGS